ncbi:OmpA family protein [Actibacterium sp. XHP0104]|uniref:OmpA family protein n=1 Tax=Actibacterium sp. XHP0104 TaxID=2984335 RepID=UPI0021E97A31|nr:OmpA family protein [Actibacterium sp. XHP0104]MCV2882341.1 OmpA family protein [Actibacterium sp. XHP0104]
MIRVKFPMVLVAGAVALTACTDINTPSNDPNQRTKEGAAVGAISGAMAGILIGDDAKSRRKGAVIGGIVGAAAGAAIGSNLDKQAAELEANLQNDQIRIVNTGDELIVTMPEGILFDIDSATVSPRMRSDLYTLSDSLLDYPGTTVEVVGHTDNTGSAAYNQQLSTRRAAAVASVLQEGGVPSRRIVAYGMGEDRPVASNLTPEGRAQNRRVEIIITPNT